MRVTVVHLSDIHFTVGANAIDSKLRQLAAAVCSTDPLCSDYIAVLSGDLVYNGTTEEFQAAKVFVKALERFVTDQKRDATVSWLMVPGNHDCYLPEGEVNLRTALVAAIAPTLQTEAPDNSILESVLAPQRSYFEFCDQLGLPAKGARRLCDWRTVEIGNAKIRFALYNTALLSTRHEQQGDLSVPITLIRNSETTDPGSDLVVSVFHHPYPWLQADAGIAFRDHIERSSEIVLTGHQHVEHAYQKQPLTDGGQTLYSEGDVLQEPKAPERSGFRLIHLDTDTQTRKVVSFQWVGSHYSVKEETDWQKYTRVTSLVGQPTPLPSFLELLSDSGIGLTHRSRGPVPLGAVFVYPDVVVSSLSAADIQRDVKGDNLLKYLTEGSRVMVRGSAYSGKTSLAKTVVKEWLRTRSFYPVLMSGTHIKHPDEASTDRLLRARTCEIYGDSGYEAYQQLPTNAKALIVDDWDESPLSQAERDKVLQTLLPQFGKVILFVRGMSYIHYVLARVKGTEAILQFDLVSIKELSHVARGDLIEKWLSLEMPRDALGAWQK